jgi:putative ABC transport system permease protein
MLFATFNFAVREMRHNLLRSLTAVPGIAIGVAAAVTMATLGRDATETARRQISEALHADARVLTTDLGMVAAVALLIGGVAVTNAMLASATERKGEIGMRLAIGARSDEVLLQFLAEAVTLSCLGGVIGLLLAFGGEIVAAPLLHVPFLFDPQVNLIALAASAVIGLVFGYVPARRAAALDPMDALRRE